MDKTTKILLVIVVVVVLYCILRKSKANSERIEGYDVNNLNCSNYCSGIQSYLNEYSNASNTTTLNRLGNEINDARNYVNNKCQLNNDTYNLEYIVKNCQLSGQHNRWINLHK